MKNIIFLASRQRFLMVLTCSWVFWPKNDTEQIWHYLKKPVWDPKCAKLDQKSDFGHVRTYYWLNKLRNMQRRIYGPIWSHVGPGRARKVWEALLKDHIFLHNSFHTLGRGGCLTGWIHPRQAGSTHGAVYRKVECFEMHSTNPQIFLRLGRCGQGLAFSDLEQCIKFREKEERSRCEKKSSQLPGEVLRWWLHLIIFWRCVYH